jgi:erythromycin esterase-like protein
MSENGEIPPVDVAVFANTGWEPKEVMDHFEWLKKNNPKRWKELTNLQIPS